MNKQPAAFSEKSHRSRETVKTRVERRTAPCYNEIPADKPDSVYHSFRAGRRAEGKAGAFLENMTTSPRKRIHLLDEIRGFAVLCMIFYHGFYSLAFLFQLDWGMALLRFFMPAEPFFAGLFIFISGISSNLSHSNLLRGVKLLGIALLVSIVTFLVVPSQVIVFGILHFLSICMILFGLLRPLQEKIPLIPGIVLSALLYLCTMQISSGVLAFGISLPDMLYQTNWLAPLGFHNAAFFSSDYFPLLPWAFVFSAGTFAGRWAAQGKFPQWMYPSRIRPLSWMGRHALILYIVHQPVIVGVCTVVEWAANMIGG